MTTKGTTGLFRRIFVPLDGSEVAERALPVAAALADRAAGEITLIMAVNDRDHLAGGHDLLDAAATHLGERETRQEVVIGLPAATRLIDYLDLDASVTVMSTHARRAVGELLIGSVADGVVRGTAKPVVLVGPHVELPTPGWNYGELVACVDSDETAERLGPIVQSCAAELGLKPWLFQVIAPDAAVAGGDAMESSSVREAASSLAAAGVRADWDVGHGDDPAAAIVDFARDRTGPIIALATHGRDPTARLRASSVTVAVARAASCPVLVVGPQGLPAPR